MFFQNIQKYSNCLPNGFSSEALIKEIVRVFEEYNSADQTWMPLKYEKDFWLTVILDIMSQQFPDIVFK